MKIKNILLMALSLVVVAALAVGGTLAYLTDRDSKVNVFTMGNVSIELQEDFEQASKLVPGVNIEKKPVIKNTGDNDAWVWLTFSIPSALDNYVQGTETGSNENVIHWNPLGATAEGYVTDARVTKAIADGHLDASLTADIIKDNNMTWNVFNSLGDGKNVYQEEIDGVKYNTYVLLYNKALTKGEVTLPSIYNVFLDAQVDIDPDGKLYKVSNGVATAINWNIKTDGAPVIYASAYAVQAEGFATVKDAYAAYQAQWGDKGAEYAPVPTVVTNSAELQAALDAAVNGDTIILAADIEGDVTVTQKAGVKLTINGNGNTIDGSITVDGKSSRYETAGVTIENIKFASDNAAPAAYINLGVSGNSGTRYTNNVTVSNCTFDYSGTGDKAAIKSYTGGDWNLTVDGCTVNSGMHSMLQVTNIEKGLTVTDCVVNSKNGINLNNTPYLNMSGCEFDTVGYCVRLGVNGSTNNGSFTIADSTLKSANDDGDAVIILRGTMTGATLNIKGTTLVGTLDITGKANIVK